MLTSTYRPYVIAGALMIATIALCPRAARVQRVETLPIALSLPDAVQGWRGEDVLFCQKETCARVFTRGELKGALTCPVCGGPLDPVSLAERHLLPAETLLAKKRYSNARGESILVSLVVSGRGQESIHRPQQCLPGQGFTIDNGGVLEVPLAGRAPLKVMGLNVHRAGEAGSAGAELAYFVYWFAGGSRAETPYHLERRLAMAWDRIVQGRDYRWAYVSLFTSRTANDPGHVERLRSFLQAFYPCLHTPDAAQ